MHNSVHKPVQSDVPLKVDSGAQPRAFRGAVSRRLNVQIECTNRCKPDAGVPTSLRFRVHTNVRSDALSGCIQARGLHHNVHKEVPFCAPE